MIFDAVREAELDGYADYKKKVKLQVNTLVLKLSHLNYRKP